MEPSVSSKNNIISYVIAYHSDCDGCIDVTRRYTSNWEKTNRLRGRELSKSEKEIGRRPWWDDFYETIRRRKLGDRERHEETEFESLDEKEPIPTSISRFNNHRLYALERHLKKFEILEPNATVLGKIKGENIYPRSAVQPVSTMETWLKQGRSIKQGEQPIKTVNARAVTLEKKRAKEIARQEGEELQVGCYAYWQTEKFRPQNVINVRVSAYLAVHPRSKYLTYYLLLGRHPQEFVWKRRSIPARYVSYWSKSYHDSRHRQDC
jgi:xeroderma pigmentosum group C-complementing protein